MKDAAGHDRMYLDKGTWISIDPEDLSVTVSDGDGYTLPQTAFMTDLKELDEVLNYVATGENPRDDDHPKEKR